MKVLVTGHKYELANFEVNTTELNQTLQFIQKEPVGEGPELRTVCDGTTNEEVIAVLVNRLNNLQTKFPCRENALAITKLEEALMWLNKRTADRITRQVEGKQIA